jgi:hypothetical protein
VRTVKRNAFRAEVTVIELALDEDLKAEITVARTHVALMCGTLPAGSAVEQLQNFCGRGWELLRTPTFTRIYRRTVADGAQSPVLARVYAEELYVPVLQMLTRVVEHGIAEGAFRPVCSHTAARVIVSSLVQQAFWCDNAEGFGPLAGGCNRVVPETLSILLGGLTSR